MVGWQVKFEVRKEQQGYCVVAQNFYLHHKDEFICEAIAALLNGKAEEAAQMVKRWTNQ